MPITKLTALVVVVAALVGCSRESTSIDLMITGNTIYQGASQAPIKGVIGIDNGKIVFIGEQAPVNIRAEKVIDAQDLIVAPGFIDPHTHACSDFADDGVLNLNANYTTQGVSTVFCNVDGGGDIDVANTFAQYEEQGIGTNVGLYIGHGSVRTAVMGRTNRAPTSAELSQMKGIVEQAMLAGALGLSTGLYYVPGNYATTNEVIELAKVAARYGGVYDSHIRDESSYSVGLVGAIKEVITIGEQAKLPVHVAHIKALGVDVWGESTQVINLINKARDNGIDVTADQYPWRASGTSIAGSLMPRETLAGTKAEYIARIQDEGQWPLLKAAMQENLRRRGGADSLLISDPTRPELRGKTLLEIATMWGISPIDAARKIVISGNARVASFNMSEQDIQAYMLQPWVMTSSDGSPGHPRKYASFPKKYHEFVKQKKWLTTGEFINSSSTLTAKTFGLTDRGELNVDYIADIVIFDENKFTPKADYIHPEELSEGVRWMVVNGELVISDGKLTNTLPGQAIRHSQAKASK
ncbi:amidohydrolase family protein [Pseudoalteromonas sp. KG3]|uniref:N-acyl-D-amino-acid deacylase family protein n=1 Tax=Pseudoalteromonas sp. KG3 TaxID=2951137 RepID=UPI00265AF075|nr:amidohydrolase family protein [Pseudoalteromonas sp. KG3]WKD25493.1 amidohydrolase family protein [Pseudoalteromonas sp. KG3]